MEASDIVLFLQEVAYKYYEMTGRNEPIGITLPKSQYFLLLTKIGPKAGIIIQDIYDDERVTIKVSGIVDVFVDSYE